jgi:DNA-binding transcriptional regulator YiaG
MVKKSKRADEMTAEELLDALGTVGWSQAEFSRRLKVHKNTVGDWVAGKYPVPGYAVAFVRVAVAAREARDTLADFLRPRGNME